MVDVYSKYARFKHKDVGFLFPIKFSSRKAPLFLNPRFIRNLVCCSMRSEECSEQRERLENQMFIRFPVSNSSFIFIQPVKSD